jgi:spore coat polysaccharide biosynthesis protein SpsF
MSPRLGIVVFSRFDSSRLPGKALRLVGGIPLLERVIRRAQLLPWPVYLATTTRHSDESLVELAERLGVPAFRGSEDDVLQRAVMVAENAGLDAFARLCGDRPLFPIETMERAMTLMQQRLCEREPLDLVTDYLSGRTPRGLTTEVIRTATLRRILEGPVSAEQQENVTTSFYDHPDAFRVVRLPLSSIDYACPGFAVDTAADVENMNKIFSVSPAIDVSAAEADRIYRI